MDPADRIIDGMRHPGRYPLAKLLFLSADINSLENALSSGAMDFIRNPFQLKDFTTRLGVLSGQTCPPMVYVRG